MTDQVIETLKVLSDFFHRENIDYHITGGLAGNIYGSKWKLSDIDIEVHFADLSRIEKYFSRNVKQQVSRYIDHEFDIWLFQLNFNGLVVDINAIEDFYIFNGNKRLKIETSFDNSKSVEYYGLQLKVQSLKEIIEYKQILKRKADVEDLLRLKP
jgi:hypothetical protein